MPMYEVEGAPELGQVSAPTWLGALGEVAERLGLGLSELGRLQVQVDRGGVVDVFDPAAQQGFRLIPVEDLFSESPAALSALDAAPRPPERPAVPERPPAPPRPLASAPPEDLDEQLERLVWDLEGSMDEEEAAAIALRGLERLLPAESGAVLLRNAQEQLVFRAAFGPAATGVLGARIRQDAGIAGFCFLTGMVVCVDNAALDARHDGTVEQQVGYATSALVAAPVPGPGRQRLGCVELLNAPGGFRDWQVQTTRKVGQALGRALVALG